MAKRLKKLRIDEVSVVDRGPAIGARVVLMKRQKPRYVFDAVGGLVPAGTLDENGLSTIYDSRRRAVGTVDKGDTSLDRALREIAETRAFLAKAAAPFVGEDYMETTDITKAAIAKVDSRIDAIIAKSDKPISRNIAVYRMSQSRDPADIEAWRFHKQLAVAPQAPVAQPAPVAVSEAFMKLQRKAEKRAAKNGTPVATEFAKLYAERPDLAAADRAFRLGSRAA